MANSQLQCARCHAKAGRPTAVDRATSCLAQAKPRVHLRRSRSWSRDSMFKSFLSVLLAAKTRLAISLT
jgi:hypothetical protein